MQSLRDHFTLDRFERAVGDGIAVSKRSSASGHWHAHNFHLLMILPPMRNVVEWKTAANTSFRTERGKSQTIVWPAGVSGALYFEATLPVVAVGLATASFARSLQDVGGIRLAPAMRCDEFVTHLVHGLAELAGNPRHGQADIAEALGIALSRSLLSDYSSRCHTAKRAGMSALSLRRVKALIESELAGELPIKRLADCAGLSSHHFSRTFYTATGQSPHQFVIARRLERAHSLLFEGTTIAEAAIRSGFSSQSHMHRHFRQAYGVTPGEFRRAYVTDPAENPGTAGYCGELKSGAIPMRQTTSCHR